MNGMDRDGGHAWVGFRFAPDATLERGGMVCGTVLLADGDDGNARRIAVSGEIGMGLRTYLAGLLRQAAGILSARFDRLEPIDPPAGRAALLEALGGGPEPPKGHLLCIDIGPSHTLLTDEAAWDRGTAAMTVGSLLVLADALEGGETAA